jgi:hypothetical protein
MTAHRVSTKLALDVTQNERCSETTKFVLLYRRLKDCSDDDPQYLPELMNTDDKIENLARTLLDVFNRLNFDLGNDRELFAAPTDSKFIAAWRDFEERFLPVLCAANISPVRAENNWALADFNGFISAGLIDQTIEMARSRAEGDKSEIGFEFFTVEEGVWWAAEDWAGLQINIGFDPRGVFRRRRLIPFVFFPRHVAARCNQDNGLLSVYENLRQAHEAYIFGAPFAALAMMRSIMEVVLRDHYGASGESLSERISSVRSLLPKGAGEVKLHRLRKIANAILHLDADKEALPLSGELSKMEMEIIWLLRALRALIEGAPLRLAPAYQSTR